MLTPHPDKDIEVPDSDGQRTAGVPEGIPTGLVRREGRLEAEVAGELNLTRATDGIGNNADTLVGERGWISPRSDWDERRTEVWRAGKTIARSVEAGSIRDVQEFSGQAKIGFFSNLGLLDKGNIGALLECTPEMCDCRWRNLTHRDRRRVRRRFPEPRSGIQTRTG